MFIVLSLGPRGKCMIASCALSTSLRLVSGTAFGMPVVPEV